MRPPPRSGLHAPLRRADVTAVNVALKRISTHLDASVSDFQWVLNAYTIVFAALLLSGGALSDRLGARRVFLIGFTIFTFASAGCGLAPSTPALIAARAVQGLGAALCIPTSLALLQSSFPSGRARTHAVSIWSGIGGAGARSGLGARRLDRRTTGLAEHFPSEHSVGVGAITLALAFAPNPGPRTNRGLDFAGQTLATFALAGIAVACIEAAPLGWRHPLVLGGVAVFLLSVPAFVAVESRSRCPILPLSLFQSPHVGAGCFIGGTFNFAYYGFVFVLSLSFQAIKGYSPVATGLAFLPMTVMAVGANLLAGRIIAHVGLRGPLLVGQSITVAGFLSLVGVDAGTSYARMFLPMLAVGIGPALSLPAYTLTVLEDAPAEQAGVAAGALNAARQAGGMLGVGTFGSLIANLGFICGMSAALISAGVVLGFGALACVAWVTSGGRVAGAEVDGWCDREDAWTKRTPYSGEGAATRDAWSSLGGLGYARAYRGICKRK